MKFKTHDMVQIAVWVALISVLSPISIPLPIGVPLTLQTILIPLSGMVLGKKSGFFASLLYVMLGFIGLPVFSGGLSGPAAVFGPTGGFILSFALMAYLAGLYAEETRSLRYLGLVLSAATNFLFGSLYFAWYNQLSLGYTFNMLVLPFIPITVIKILITDYLYYKIKKIKA